jgi:hypothetical protein
MCPLSNKNREKAPERKQCVMIQRHGVGRAGNIWDRHRIYKGGVGNGSDEGGDSADNTESKKL